jgi:hypothetical protein
MPLVGLGLAFGVLVVAGAASPLPARAADQGLQALLQKSGCAPSKVMATDLSPTVKAYEVTCRGRTEPLAILCQGTECRVQARPRDDDER